AATSGVGSWLTVCSSALAKPCARASDIFGRRGNGLVVRDGTKYSTLNDGTSDFGCAGVVGLPDRVAPFHAGWPGLSRISSVIKTRLAAAHSPEKWNSMPLLAS